MPGHNVIPWDEYLQTYNKMKGTNFATPRDWIKHLYLENGGYVSPVLRIIDISHSTMVKYLKLWDLYTPKPKGGDHSKDRPVGKKAQRVLDIPKDRLAKLTIQQISELCGLERSYCSSVLRQYELPYNPVYKNRQK